MWDGGSHWGQVCGVLGAWRGGTVHPSAHHSLLPPLLPPSFCIPAATGRAVFCFWTKPVLEAGDTSCLQSSQGLKTHSMDVTLITTQTPLKRKPEPVTPVPKAFQRLPVALRITLKSLPCPTKALPAPTPVSLPGFISSDLSLNVSAERGFS